MLRILITQGATPVNTVPPVAKWVVLRDLDFVTTPGGMQIRCRDDSTGIERVLDWLWKYSPLCNARRFIGLRPTEEYELCSKGLSMGLSIRQWLAHMRVPVLFLLRGPQQQSQ